MNDPIIYIDTDRCHPPQPSDSIREGRSNFAHTQWELNGIEATILVLAYNRLDKTRLCIESILEYTGEVNYELLLIDNGSTDGTLEYFKAVPYEKKKIVRISYNLAAHFAFSMNSMAEFGKYLVFVANDVIVTPHWLDHLMTCASSDPSVGMVCPVSSNASNLQNVDLDFGDLEQMQKKAGDYNQSDPGKWQERLRLITYVVLLKKETLFALGYPYLDCGFFHDFSDDDLTFRVRRAGYKAILAKDVWVHHNHDFRRLEGKDPVQFRQSLEIGRNNFREKYRGIDAWDDVNNFLFDLTDYIKPPKTEGTPRILGIDVKCGTPILEIKNKLREMGYLEAGLSAFSQDVKYDVDLKSICGDLVVCDREEFMRDSFPEGFYDYVVMDRPINRYHEPQKVLDDILRLSKKGAQIFFPLYNTYSFYEYLNMLGSRDIYSASLAYNLSFERMEAALKKTCRMEHVAVRSYDLSSADRELIQKAVRAHPMISHPEDCCARLMIENYWFVAEKL